MSVFPALPVVSIALAVLQLLCGYSSLEGWHWHNYGYSLGLCCKDVFYLLANN